MLLPAIHPNAANGTKTATRERTVVLNGRSFRVRPSTIQRRVKQKDWFNMKELGLKDAVMEDNDVLVTDILRANSDLVHANSGANLVRAKDASSCCVPGLLTFITSKTP
jgi:hypothetical protein